MSEADAAAGRSSTAKGGVAAAMNGGTEISSRKTEPSKRQRRLQQQYKNTNGLWEQPQPRIKSLEQREAAHLRASGLVESSSRTREDGKSTTGSANATKILEETDKNTDVTSHFARKLGSADARVRHQTVLVLKAYLKIRSDPSNSNGGFTELDLSKLWKCLWYTLYLCDRAPVQDELSQHLCSLIWSFEGTMEQDEYIAQAYLDSCNESGFMDDEALSLDDDDEVVLEEIENTLEDEHSNEEGDESSESSELDLEAKQLAILQEGEGYHEDDSVNESDEELISSESSDVDYEAKQLALLNEEEEFDDEEEDVEIDTESDPDEVEDHDTDESDDTGSDEEPTEIRHCQGAHLAALFVRTFWSTCLREWGKMDKYRIDKFYTCLRYMLAVTFDYMASRHWSLGIIRLFNDALYEEVLSKTPNGVRYHIIDCCLEELCRAVARSGCCPLTEATLIDVLEPYFALAQTGDGDDTVQARVTEQVLVKFLTHYSVFSNDYVAWRKSGKASDPIQPKIGANGKQKSDILPKDLVLDQVHVGTLSKFIFEVAADDAVEKDEYRQALYNVHKQYERVMRQVGLEYDVDLEGELEMDEDGEYSADENENEDDMEQDVELDDKNVLDVQADEYVENGGQLDVVEVTKIVGSRREVTLTQNEDASEIKEATECIATATTKKKKRKKKKKIEADAGEMFSAVKEEVVSITKAEQTAAKNALKEKQDVHSKTHAEAVNGNSRKRRSDVLRSDRVGNEESLKRVKFGDINRARSWKASMQGLQEIKIKPILQKSPECSILLKKGSGPICLEPPSRGPMAHPQSRGPNSANMQGKRNAFMHGRKKARDYF
jgi:Nucleolar protein,Nop52